ncbi:MAG: hypothetical protein WCY33_02715, partial [Clostridia bacterium]
WDEISPQCAGMLKEQGTSTGRWMPERGKTMQRVWKLLEHGIYSGQNAIETDCVEQGWKRYISSSLFQCRSYALEC